MLLSQQKQQQVFTHTCPPVIDPLEKLWLCPSTNSWLYPLLPLCATASARAYGDAAAWLRSLRDPARRLIVLAPRGALYKLMINSLRSTRAGEMFHQRLWILMEAGVRRRGYSRARVLRNGSETEGGRARGFWDQKTTPTDHRGSEHTLHPPLPSVHLTSWSKIK